jgi:predicted nucleotidyltransferase
MPAIDLLPRDLEIVRSILARFVPGREVRMFGSRTSAKARRHSDLDLVVMTDRQLELDVYAGVKRAFSESSLPFKVDVLDAAVLAEDFRRRILEGSVVLQEAAAISRPPSKRHIS